MKDNHFNKIFWYISVLTTSVLAYVWAITFLPIDKENLRFVDTALGFLLGTGLGSGINYLLGGTPKDIKKSKEDETKDDAQI